MAHPMAGAPFVHLHVHSSTRSSTEPAGSGAGARAAELEMPAVALTDHGASPARSSSTGRRGSTASSRCSAARSTSPTTGSRRRTAAHLTLLAESNEGYANLIKLASAGYLGYYYKPRRLGPARVAREGHRRALRLPLRAGVQGARERQPPEAEAEVARLADIFGRESVYLEIQDAGLEVQKGSTLARGDRGRPGCHSSPPATSTTCATRTRARTGAPLHPVRGHARQPESLALRHRPVLLEDAGGDGAGLPDYPEAVERSRSPSAAPSRSSSASSACRLRRPTARRLRLPRRALRKRPAKALRHGDAGAPGAAQLRAEDDPGDGLRGLLPDRLGLHPLRQDERDRGRPGPRLGAGSIVAYALEITDIDPIKYDLLFERFLNPGRKTMPDIDIDFSVYGRDQVINYVAEKYGRDQVAQIITFGTMMARAAVRDAGRVLDIPTAPSTRSPS